MTDERPSTTMAEVVGVPSPCLRLFLVRDEGEVDYVLAEGLAQAASIWGAAARVAYEAGDDDPDPVPDSIELCSGTHMLFPDGSQVGLGG